MSATAPKRTTSKRKPASSFLWSVITSTLMLAGMVLLLTCSYYMYRYARAEHTDGGVHAARSRSTYTASDVRTDAKASVNLAYGYAHESYFTLRPAVPLVRETILNPQLLRMYGSSTTASRASLAALSNRLEEQATKETDAMERAKTQRAVEALRTTPPLRRYVLSHTQLGQRYLLRLSYLGSPSVSYRFYLYHIRASTLNLAKEKAKAHSGGHDAGTDALSHKRREAFLAKHAPGAVEDVDAAKMPAGLAAFVPMDTEVVALAMHERYAAQFAMDEAIVYDAADLQRRAEAEEAAAKTAKEGGGAPRKNSEDPFVAVLEVLPVVQSLAEDPRDFAVLAYNLQMNPLTFNLVPDMALPLIGCFSLVCVVLGKGILYRWLSAAVVRSAECGQSRGNENGSEDDDDAILE